jgi:DNA-binding MarR family transcriptional regulator
VRGLTAAHARVIPFVPPDGASVQWLATKADVRKQTMAQSVEQLVAAGLVERRPDPGDRRASLVVLTEAGLAIRPMSRKAGGKVERAWADQLGKDRLEVLRAALIELAGYEA